MTKAPLTPDISPEQPFEFNTPDGSEPHFNFNYEVEGFSMRRSPNSGRRVLVFPQQFNNGLSKRGRPIPLEIAEHETVDPPRWARVQAAIADLQKSKEG